MSDRARLNLRFWWDGLAIRPASRNGTGHDCGDALTDRHHSRLRIRRQTRPVPASLADRNLDEFTLVERVWLVADTAGASAAGDASGAAAGAASGAAGLLEPASTAGGDSAVS